MTETIGWNKINQETFSFIHLHLYMMTIHCLIEIIIYCSIMFTHFILLSAPYSWNKQNRTPNSFVYNSIEFYDFKIKLPNAICIRKKLH